MLYTPEGSLEVDMPHMKHLINTYGKTWHTWQVDKDDLPLGVSQLHECTCTTGKRRRSNSMHAHHLRRGNSCLLTAHIGMHHLLCMPHMGGMFQYLRIA